MGYFRTLVDNMNSLVFGTDPYQKVAEEFTAEVNQQLLQQIQEKDARIEELKELIARLCYSTLASVNEALYYFADDEEIEEWIPEEEDAFDEDTPLVDGEDDDFYAIL
jgi:hypothetical protein